VLTFGVVQVGCLGSAGFSPALFWSDLGVCWPAGFGLVSCGRAGL
jgi:hypothetical protein